MINGRKNCFVPYCKNSTYSTPKKIFLTVPSREPERSKWFKAVRRSLKQQLSHNPTFYVCEDHFNLPGDVLNQSCLRLIKEGRIVQIKLKPGVIPSKFDCQQGQPDKSENIKRSYSKVYEQLMDYSQSNLETEVSNLSLGYDFLGLKNKKIDQKRDIGVQVEPFSLDKGTQILDEKTPKRTSLKKKFIKYASNVKTALSREKNTKIKHNAKYFDDYSIIKDKKYKFLL